MTQTDANLIDLDRPTEHAHRSMAVRNAPWRQLATVRVPVVVAFGLMLLGAVGGGFVIHRSDGQRRPSAPAALFVLAATDRDHISVDVDAGHASLDGLLTVVNAGSAPINIRDLTMTGTETRIVDLPQGQRIQPGTISSLEVTVLLDCGAHNDQARSEASLTVEVDRSNQQASVAFDGGPWAERLLQACLFT